jgi:hypothetical protein
VSNAVVNVDVTFVKHYFCGVYKRLFPVTCSSEIKCLETFVVQVTNRNMKTMAQVRIQLKLPLF